MSERKYEYDAVLHEESDGGAWVAFPWDIREQLGKGRRRHDLRYGRDSGELRHMQELDMDILQFFDTHRAALPLFAALEEMIFERLSPM